MSWRKALDELPAIGSAVEIRLGASPDASFGEYAGSIMEIVGLPELGKSWLVTEGFYVTQWRYLQ